MSSRNVWSRILIVAGGIAMLVGAIDPVEGSLLILPGSGLSALGAYLGKSGRRAIGYRLLVFVLIAIGVGAVWALSLFGGFGDKTGISMWWGMLILPYLVGWSMGIWGPDSPRWLLVSGMVVSIWYLTILVMTLKGTAHHGGDLSALPGIVLGAVGALTIGGCIFRLIHRSPGRRLPD